MMAKKSHNAIKSRIIEVTKERGLKSKLAQMLGFERGSISDLLKKPGDPPLHYVEAVSKLTGVSIQWILSGEGDGTVNVADRNKDQDDVNSLYKEIVKYKDKEIEDQKRTIAALISIEKSYEEQIKVFKQKIEELEIELKDLRSVSEK